MRINNICEHTFIGSEITSNALILDLGANRCGFANQMAVTYGCKVIAVEPNPELFRSWDVHTQVTPINVAVSDTSQDLPFYIHSNAESSSFTKPAPEEITNVIKVRTTTLSKLVADLSLERIDLLKLDIEGSEIALLQHSPLELLAKIPQITVEFHDFNGLTKKTDVLKTIKFLEKAGFEAYNMWMRSHGDVLLINRALIKLSVADRYRLGFLHKYTQYIKKRLGM